MKKLSEIESNILQFIDSHIRLIQYSCYAIGLVGVAAIIKSTHTFTYFAHPEQIPKEFISKGVKLQGRVVNIQSLPLQSSASVSDGELLHSIRLQMEHIPIVKFKWRSGLTQSPLPIDIAGVWCTSKGAQFVNQLILNKEVWFNLYGIHKDQNVLYSSVSLKRTWKFWLQRDIGICLLKEQQGCVAAWTQDFNLNDRYAQYFRRLLHYEANFKHKKSSLFTKATNYFKK